MNAMTRIFGSRPHLEAEAEALAAAFADALTTTQGSSLALAREHLARQRAAHTAAREALKLAAGAARDDFAAGPAKALLAAAVAEEQRTDASVRAARSAVAGRIEDALPAVRAAMTPPCETARGHVLQTLDVLERLLEPMASAGRQLRSESFGDAEPRLMEESGLMVALVRRIRAIANGA